MYLIYLDIDFIIILKIGFQAFVWFPFWRMECFDEKTFSFIITDNYSGEGEENSIYEYASGDKISEYDVYI